MRIALVILLLIAAGVGVLAAVIAGRPSEFSIQRSASMAAPPDIVFGLVNDFHRWEGWSPWAKLDPAMKIRYDGAPAGVGASYGWQGDRTVGEGRMAITESKPNEQISVDLQFLKPFAARNVAVFRFEPDSAGTKVTWTMRGQSDFMGKAVGLFMNMDDLVGRQFEQGLASMRTLAEGEALAANR
ncbi:MAG TPA: SRPBCC family protein [Myxococcota bacterium]|nr:SRPBCC family protein [Myxococcota bacterium]